MLSIKRVIYKPANICWKIV